jgi:hypothetical protein
MCGLCAYTTITTIEPGTKLGEPATAENVTETTLVGDTSVVGSGSGSSGNNSGDDVEAVGSSTGTGPATHQLNVEYILFTSVLGAVFLLTQAALLCTPQKEVRYYFN